MSLFSSKTKNNKNAKEMFRSKGKRIRKETLICLFFLALGFVLLGLETQINSVEVDYSRKCHNKNCTIQFSVPKMIDSPIFIFYMTSNLVESSKNFRESYSKRQLFQGEFLDIDEIPECEPAVMNAYNGNVADLPSKYPLTPCGIKPVMFFNDSFALFDEQKNSIIIRETNIALDEDKDLYRNTSNRDFQWTDIENVWMRSKGIPKDIKLWGVIENSLERGNYHLNISNCLFNFILDYNLPFISKKIIMVNKNSIGLSNTHIIAASFGISIVSFIILFLIFYRKRAN